MKPGFAGAGHLTWREAMFCWSRSPYLERSQVLLEQVTLPREKPCFAGAGHLTWRGARFCWSRSPYLERSQVLLEQVTLPGEKPGFTGAGHLTWREARFCWSRSPYLEKSQVLLEQVTLPGEKPGFAGAGHLTWREARFCWSRSHFLLIWREARFCWKFRITFCKNTTEDFTKSCIRLWGCMDTPVPSWLRITFPPLPREKPGLASAGHMSPFTWREARFGLSRSTYLEESQVLPQQVTLPGMKPCFAEAGHLTWREARFCHSRSPNLERSHVLLE